MRIGYWSLILGFVAGLAGCGGRDGLAPVSELIWRHGHWHASAHRVRAGETLYSIAFRYEKDYLALARYNHLPPPYHIRVGQVLRLDPPPVRQTRVRSVYTPRATIKRVTKPTTPIASGRTLFVWPMQGRVLHTFSLSRGQKGIDLVGQPGTPVKAAASGVVAYAGSGLVGYGNLIIIKHSNQYITAYGNLEKPSVREGQSVTTGQVLGRAGPIAKDFYGVHFEVRREGKPMNPMIYLRK